MIKKLNLGCGLDIKKDYINVDIKTYNNKTDVICDLDKLPYPFQSNSIDEIYISHTMEHLNIETQEIMEEFHRIIKPTGKVIVRVPHFTTRRAWSGIGHKRVYASDMFDSQRYQFHGTGLNFIILNKKIIFGKKYAVWNHIIEPLVNLFPIAYEDTPLRIFPAQEMRFELKPINKLDL